jgi:subtilisin family serine protease
LALIAAASALMALQAQSLGRAQSPPVERIEPGDDAASEIERFRMQDRKAFKREALRKRVQAEARRRGVTREEWEAMDPAERAALIQAYRARLNANRAMGWRMRMAQRRLSAGELEVGEAGRRFVRAQILATDPNPNTLVAAQRLGFRIVRERQLEPLGVRVVVLAPPPGVDARRALARLRAADPAGSYDLNHVFDPSAATPVRAGGAVGFVPGAAFEGRGVRIGVVDTGVDASHPALAGARVTARSFVATGADRETGHGTAVAALLVGTGDGYQGVIPGASVFVADVFGSSGAGGSAEAIAEGLAWLDAQNVDVINLSLEGPANRTVQAVVAALQRKGRIIVAAVGNEGPTQPVAFPAAYDGVIGVTAIDIERRVYIAANRGPEVDFAALGVNVLAAVEGQSYEAVSGTSFAAPLVAAAIAAENANQRAARDPTLRLQALTARAIDLGAPGRDPVYGAGAIELSR